MDQPGHAGEDDPTEDGSDADADGGETPTPEMAGAACSEICAANLQAVLAGRGGHRSLPKRVISPACSEMGNNLSNIAGTYCWAATRDSQKPSLDRNRSA